MNIVPNDRPPAGLPSLLPAPTERALRCAVTRLVPPIEPGRTRYTIAASDAPSEPIRAALVNRQNRIERWMEPAGAEAATECYKDLLANLAAANVDKETEIRELRGWIEATSKLPLFALKGACNAFRDGVLGNREWMPKPAAVCHEARRRMEGLAKEKREIDAVLSAEIAAPVANPERKAKLLADAMAFVSDGREMDRVAGMHKRDPEAERTAKIHAESLRLCIEQGRLDTRPMPQISAYLRHQLGLPDLDMVPDPEGWEAA